MTKQRETKPDETSAEKTWIPPRGIRLFEIPSRPDAPFAVQWRVDGKVKTKTFPDAKAQLKYAKDLAADASQHGVAAYRLDEGEARAWRAFRSDLGEGVELADVIKCWRAHGQIQTTIRIPEAIAAFLEAKKQEGVDEATLNHLRPVFADFKDAIGDVNAAAVKLETLSAYVSKLTITDRKTKKIQPAAAGTKRTVYKRIRTFFSWLKATKQIAVNPCDGWKSPKEIAAPISVMSVPDGEKLFLANLDQPRALLGRLALEAFAGMRHETAAELPATAIDFVNRTITIPAAIDKNRREQYIENAPEILWAWLAWACPKTDADGWEALSGRAYTTAKSSAFIRANIAHPRNVLRHSAASYYLAATGDAGKVAAMLTHANLKMLWAHYRGKGGGRANGEAWIAIAPPTVAGDFPALVINEIAASKSALASLGRAA